MANDKNTSVLKDALKDIKEIMDEAKKNVHSDIEKMIPEKFDALLKEEINKIKNKKESGKGNINESKSKEKINEDIGMGDEMLDNELSVKDPVGGDEDINFDDINFDDIKAELESSDGDVESDLEQAEELRQESESMDEVENENDP